MVDQGNSDICKWNVTYSVKDGSKIIIKKDYVFGKSEFDAIANIVMILKIIERGKSTKILNVELNQNDLKFNKGNINGNDKQRNITIKN